MTDQLTWREVMVVKILLIIAKYLTPLEAPLRKDIENIINSVSCSTQR